MRLLPEFYQLLSFLIDYISIIIKCPLNVNIRCWLNVFLNGMTMTFSSYSEYILIHFNAHAQNLWLGLNIVLFAIFVF